MAAGDLYVIIAIAPHKLFSVNGNDLMCKMLVDISTAVLGGKIEIPTLSGHVNMAIPPETDDGKTFRLKGMGMPDYDYPSKKGDLYVNLHIAVPKNVSPQEKELFKKLAALGK